MSVEPRRNAVMTCPPFTSAIHRRARRAPSGGPRAALAVAMLAVAVVTPFATIDAGAADAAPREGALADGLPQPLDGASGDAARGRALVVARNPANCVLCHAVPDPAIRFSGDLGPSLAGAGRRLNAAQLRLRVVDSQRLNPATIMPAYHRVDGLVNVAAPYRGKPILTAGEVEDIVAYLVTLQ